MSEEVSSNNAARTLGLYNEKFYIIECYVPRCAKVKYIYASSLDKSHRVFEHRKLIYVDFIINMLARTLFHQLPSHSTTKKMWLSRKRLLSKGLQVGKDYNKSKLSSFNDARAN